jgi:ADP-heptose:LPS heptosyltransferase
MAANDNILELLEEKRAEVIREARRGAILQPGAIGDCILTLPLVEFMKESLELGGIDILGHTEYIGIFPGRTCVDGIRSIDSMNLHRLFVDIERFDLEDRDPLISTFADYSWIVSFLGEPDSAFEQNLIFTANCSHSAEVITLSMLPPKSVSLHLGDFYIQQFVKESRLSLDSRPIQNDKCLIKVTDTDINRGKELLKEIGVDISKRKLVIQPGSGGPEKCWHFDNFLSIAKELASRDIESVFLLGPAECERLGKRIEKIRRVGRCLKDLSLPEVLGLLSCADSYIGNDSGVTHLAAGLGVRTFAVFGPTNPDVYGPIGPAVTVFSSDKKSFAEKPSAKLQRKLLEMLIT